MIGPWGNDTIIEVQPTWTEVRGNLVADWKNPTRINHDGFEVRPAQGGRDFELGVGIKRVRRVYGPPSAVIDPRSRIELPDDEGQFTILDGPNTSKSAEMLMGYGDGPGVTSLTVGIKEG